MQTIFSLSIQSRDSYVNPVKLGSKRNCNIVQLLYTVPNYVLLDENGIIYIDDQKSSSIFLSLQNVHITHISNYSTIMHAVDKENKVYGWNFQCDQIYQYSHHAQLLKYHGSITFTQKKFSLSFHNSQIQIWGIRQTEINDILQAGCSDDKIFAIDKNNSLLSYQISQVNCYKSQILQQQKFDFIIAGKCILLGHSKCGKIYLFNILDLKAYHIIEEQNYKQIRLLGRNVVIFGLTTIIHSYDFQLQLKSKKKIQKSFQPIGESENYLYLLKQTNVQSVQQNGEINKVLHPTPIQSFQNQNQAYIFQQLVNIQQQISQLQNIINPNNFQIQEYALVQQCKNNLQNIEFNYQQKINPNSTSNYNNQYSYTNPNSYRSYTSEEQQQQLDCHQFNITNQLKQSVQFNDGKDQQLNINPGSIFSFSDSIIQEQLSKGKNKSIFNKQFQDHKKLGNHSKLGQFKSENQICIKMNEETTENENKLQTRSGILFPKCISDEDLNVFLAENFDEEIELNSNAYSMQRLEQKNDVLKNEKQVVMQIDKDEIVIPKKQEVKVQQMQKYYLFNGVNKGMKLVSNQINENQSNISLPNKTLYQQKSYQQLLQQCSYLNQNQTNKSHTNIQNLYKQDQAQSAKKNYKKHPQIPKTNKINMCGPPFQPNQKKI